jgi:Tol biopolymer transport system component
VWPSTSRVGNRLVYLHDYQDRDIWRLSVPRSGGRILWNQLSLNGATPLIASTRVDQTAEYSPDGTRIAFSSARSGFHEIWVCDAEGRGAHMVTSFRGLPAWWPRWSPDGERLAFFGRTEDGFGAYIVPAQGGSPHLVAADAIWPSWSRNGRWLYYHSDRSGRNEIWKSLADGAVPPVQVTLNGGYAARESPDGKYLYYSKPGAELWRSPTGGGPEVRVLEGPGLDSIVPQAPMRNWLPLDEGVLLADPDRLALRFFPDSTGGQATTPEIPGLLPRYGLSLSPDRRWLLVTLRSRALVDVMLIDGFR